MTTTIRWITVPQTGTGLFFGQQVMPILGEQPDGHARVMFVAVVDVLAALDLSTPDDLRETLDLLLVRESEHNA